MSRTWASGTEVGGTYRLESPIGKGGFGAVFRGRALSSNALVAIKLLSRSAMVRDDGIARFRREAELAMQLKHESTIRVLGSGDAGDGTPYIAFELLDGTSLDEVLARGPLSPDQAVAVALALLGSLAEAHALGIVHRDVKPANVFMCERPAGLIKLLDFGVAKSTMSNATGLTADGLMVGTPAYMAPEQISGRDVSPATDLYAVALVLAEVLTGRPVYNGAPLAICMDKLRGLPRPFDDRVRALSFFQVLERATCSEPRSRYASAEEMRMALLATRGASSAVPFEPSTLPSRPSGGTDIIEAPLAPLDTRGASAAPARYLPAAEHVAPGATGPTAPVATPQRPGARSSFRPASDDATAFAMSATLRDEGEHRPGAAGASVSLAGGLTQAAPGQVKRSAAFESAPPRPPATAPVAPTSRPPSRRGLILVLVAAALLAVAAVLAWRLRPFGRRRNRSRRAPRQENRDP